MLLLKIFILASILPVEAYVRSDGSLTLDKAEINLRARVKSNSLKNVYSVKEDKSNARKFTLEGSAGSKYFSGQWEWKQEGKNTICGELELKCLKDTKPQELAPYFNLPFKEYSEAVLEVNGAKGKPSDEAFFRKDRAKEFKFLLPEKKTISVCVEDESEIQVQNFNKWSKSWLVRFAMNYGGKSFKKGDKAKIKITLNSKSGFNLHQFKNYSITGENEAWVKYEHIKDFASGSALDFSGMGLQDAPSGKYGWLQARDGSFFFEGRPDQPVRFCGTNLCQTANYLTHELADSLIDRIVKLGYNTLRIHHHDKYLPDEENWDRLDYLVAKGIEKGIYFTTDMYVSRVIDSTAIGMESYGKKISGGLYKSLVPCYEPAFEDWCKFSRMFFEHVNPYTGRAYKDEPALNLVSLINESKLSGCKQLDNPAIQDAWHRFGGEGTLKNGSKRFKEFEDYLHKEAYTKCGGFLRSIGVKALLTTDNNGHNAKETKGASALYDYIDDHYYVDHPHFLFTKWSLPSSLGNTNTVYNGGVGTLKKEEARTGKKPWVITEWNYCGPNRYRSLGGLMCGSTAAANNWDGLWRFAYSHSSRDISSFSAYNPSTFNLATDPINIASERATVCLFLRGDAKSMDEIVMDKETGSLQVTTERTCGLFTYGGKLSAGPLEATIGGSPASIWVSSLDKEAIANSGRLLLVHITDAHGDGAKFADSFRDIIMSWGKDCLIEKGSADVVLSLNNAKAYELYELRADGQRVRKLKTAVKGGKLTFTVSTDGPSGGRIYYEIVKK